MFDIKPFSLGESRTQVEIKPVRFGGNGIKLNGTLYIPAGANKNNRVPAAVFCHGYGGKQADFETSAIELAAEGIATFTFDFRGHGESEGLLDGSIVDDILDAWDYVQSRPEVNGKNMGLIGHSMGAFSAVQAAAKLKKAKVLVTLACPGEVKYPVAGNPQHFAYPLFKQIVKVCFKISTAIKKLQVRADWNKFVDFWPKTKSSEALTNLAGCSKLFVFCLSDYIAPYKNFLYPYAMASEPKQVMVGSGRHTTPIESSTLRTQWVKWTVGALHGRHVT